jgi:hypothetical protein
MESFIASVQYDDWKGTAAADNADDRDIHALLKEKSAYDPDKELVIGVSVWIGENRGGKAEAPFVRALIVDMAKYETVDQWLQNEKDPLPVKGVDVEITTDEFIGLFKRFSVVLTKTGLNLNGRTYTSDD